MSITSVTYAPLNWQSAYNPIVWTCYSDKNLEIDMNYVFDVYINAATGATAPTYRIKQRPNPSGYGQIDASPLVQPYIDISSFYPTSATGAYLKHGDALAFVHIKVGEEYQVNGAQITFDGYGATGQPSYLLGSTGPTAGVGADAVLYPYYGGTGFNNNVRAFPSTLDQQDQMNMMRQAVQQFYWTFFLQGKSPFTTLGYLLSVWPSTYTRKLRFWDSHTVTFLNRWEPLQYGSYASSILGFQYNAYDINGVGVTSGMIYNTIGNGGGPQADNTYTSTTETRATDLMSFRCGFTELGFRAFTINGGTEYAVNSWTIQAFAKLSATSDPTPVSAVGPLYRFERTDYGCSPISDLTQGFPNALYPTVRIAWLNSLGGIDYYNFDMFWEEGNKSEQTIYNRASLDWSGSSPINKTDPSENYMRGGDKIVNKVTTTNFTIQTDWLTQGEIEGLGQIASSPLVWIIAPYRLSQTSYAIPAISTGVPIPVVIENLDYTYKNVKQTKLVQASFNGRFSQPQTMQNQ